ncbi:MAG TPA: hypothetical protein VMI75_38630 [Polyangiaceae bacterium]|nr:hypothetical protein [Polyangiaceae bacterium]
MSARKWALLAGTAGCLAMVGCAPDYPDHYIVQIDPGFTPDQQEQVLEAVAQWNAALPVAESLGGTQPALSPIVGPCLLDELAPGTLCVMPEPGAPEGGEVEGKGGCDESGVGLVYLYPDAIPGSLSQAAAHELGHAMGLGHLAAGNVMCASPGCASLTVQAGDAAAWKAVRGR